MQFWESEKVFFSGDEYFQDLLTDISEAKSTITVEVYIFNDDELGHKIVEQLIVAHQRGVKVQVIVDGVGSYQFYSGLYRHFSEAQVPVKLFNPLPFLHPFYGKLSFFRKFQIFAARATRLNQRNHRKIITIDEKILYTGSFNFTAEHTSLYSNKAWKDMGVRVTGPGVRYGVLNFKRNWKFRDYLKYKRHMKSVLKVNWKQFPLQLNHTLFMKRNFHENFLRRINKAEKRVWFTSPYFIPKRRVIKVLCRAAQRGVDVRLLLSKKSDVALFHSLQFFYYPYLIKSGVKVYHYAETVLHAKNYIIDDWMTIGSTNLNHRSLLHDLEVDMVIQNDANKELIIEHFLGCAREECRTTLEELKALPLRKRFLANLFFIFRYWF